MKKIYLLTIFLALALLGLKLNAATGPLNLLKGSNMEKADSVLWDTSRLANDPTASVEAMFGYTDDVPTAGSGGCLYIKVTNTGTNGTHIMFYQEVTIKAHHRYVMNVAYKQITPMNNSWFEGWAGKTPISGNDYSASYGQFLAGFKWGGWLTACVHSDSSSANLDCTFLTNPQLDCQNTKDTITMADSIMVGATKIPNPNTDSTLIVGFKMGIWAHACSVSAVVDNVVLLDIDSIVTAVRQVSDLSVNVFPNPANTTISYEGTSQFEQATVLNMLGQEMFTVKNFGKTIDVSGLKAGIYFVKFRDANNNLAVAKFRKL
jgi:hypothetical protein